jgi:hypothetical protein
MASTDVEEEGADVDLSMTIDLDTPATSPTGKHIDLSATIDLDDSASMPPDSPRTGLLTKEEMMGQDLAASGFAEYDSDRENNDSPKKAPVKNIHDDVAEWVQEYFQFQGFSMTLDCFQAEFLSKKYSVNVQNAVEGSDLVGIADNRQRKINKIMRYFDEGNAASFVHEWNSNVPLHVRESEIAARKSFFMAHVYFLAREMKAQSTLVMSGKTFSPRSTKRANSKAARSPSKRQMRSPALQSALDRFRAYLEDEGGDVTTIEPTLGKYHALMYVSNPSRNTEFDDMFHASREGAWVASVRGGVVAVLESVLENVPTPRILQMYEAFMTSYTGFNEQLKEQQMLTMEMNRLARRLFQLSVKITRDVGASLPENSDLPSAKNAEKIDGDYMFRVRKMLREVRQELRGATDRRKKKTPKDLNATFEKKLPPFLMGQPPPLDFNKVREGTALAHEDTMALLDALWWRLAYSSPPAMGPVISKDKFAKLQAQMRHHVARDMIDGDIFWVLTREEDRDAHALLRDIMALHESSRPTEFDEHARLRAAGIRVVDALVTWKEGREYFGRMSNDSTVLLTEMIAKEILPQEGTSALSIGSSSDIVRSRRVTRRHSISALLKLSNTSAARLAMVEAGVITHVSKAIEGSLAPGGANDLESGVIRHACALVLNLLSEPKALDVISANENGELASLTSALCLTMEQEAGKGKTGDRCGRRYASAALFGLLCRKACRDSAKGDLEQRLRSLVQRHALVRSDRFFVHEIECTLSRLESEDGDLDGPRPPPELSAAPERDRDYESDDEDFVGNSGEGEATPVQTAITRSEMILRSADYSFKQKTVPGDNISVRSILEAVEDDTEEAVTMLETIQQDKVEEEDEFV